MGVPGIEPGRNSFAKLESNYIYNLTTGPSQYYFEFEILAVYSSQKYPVPPLVGTHAFDFTFRRH